MVRRALGTFEWPHVLKERGSQFHIEDRTIGLETFTYVNSCGHFPLAVVTAVPSFYLAPFFHEVPFIISLRLRTLRPPPSSNPDAAFPLLYARQLW